MTNYEQQKLMIKAKAFDEMMGIAALGTRELLKQYPNIGTAMRQVILRAFSQIEDLPKTTEPKGLEVYLVVEDVDLGYQISEAFFDEAKAQKICDEKNLEYKEKYGRSGKTSWFHLETVSVGLV